MSSITHDAGFWRARAEEARTLAGQMTDPMTKGAMLQIAEGYDEAVVHALVRAACRQTRGDLTVS